MKIEVVSRGTRGARPPLLFIHGAFHSAACWDHHYLPWFADRGWETHALSLRGHGGSSGDAAPDMPGLADYLDDVRSVMQRIGRPVVLIGHSMGGVLAQMARAQRQNVVASVLLASSPLRPALPVVLRMLALHPVAFVRSQLFGDTEAGRSAFTSFFFAPDLDPALRARYTEDLSGESDRALKDVFSRDPPPRSDRAAGPALVVAGRDDWSIPLRDQRQLAEHLGASFEICSGAHDLMLDPHWMQSATAIDSWLRSLIDNADC